MIQSNDSHSVHAVAADHELVFRSAACTCQSPGDSENGDCWFVSDDADLVLVADSVGETNDGVRPSQLVCDSLVESLRRSKGDNTATLTSELSDALWRASRQVRRRTRLSETTGVANPGSTVVIGVRCDNRLLVKSVGDARAYLVRNGIATQLTADQTVEGILSGIGAVRPAGIRNLKQQTLLSFLGQHDFVPNDEVRLVTVRPGDRFVFCTDGVSSAADGAEISAIVSRASGPDAAAESLVDVAMIRNSVEDATCVVVFADDFETESVGD